jgi:hypothetical protein
MASKEQLTIISTTQKATIEEPSMFANVALTLHSRNNLISTILYALIY